jgi:hypothetical protein
MRRILQVAVIVFLGWVGFSMLTMHWKQARSDPLQQYYNKVDSMTPLELDQEYAKLIRTMPPRERADEADQMQLFPGAEHERRALKYHAATGAMSSAWNQLEETVKAFPNLPSISPSPTDSDIAASPGPQHKPHHHQQQPKN